VDYEAHPIGLLMGLHLMKDKYSTHRETTFLMEINHNRKAILEDMTFYLGKVLKDSIKPNFD